MVILIDTSVWVDHFRKADAGLTRLVAQGRILQHPYVTGEIVVGDVQFRAKTIWGLRNLPRIDPVEEEDFHDFLEASALAGTGLGFVDIHVLAAASKHANARIWTKDRRMRQQADRLQLMFEPLA